MKTNMCNFKSDIGKDNGEAEKRKNVPFETAMELTGFGKFNYAMLSICFMALLSMAIEMFGMSFIVQASACDLGLSLEQRGLLSAIPMIGIIFTAYFWGYITDTRGRRLTLLISMFMGFLSSFLSSFAPNMASLAALKLISASFVSAANSCSYTILGEFQPKKYRDKMLVFLSSSTMFVETVMSLLAYPVLSKVEIDYPMPLLGIHYKPWRLLVVVMGLPMALCGICILWASESPKFLISQGRDEEALEVLNRMYTINTGKDKSTFPVESLHFSEENNFSSRDTLMQSLWKQCAPLFKRPLVRHTIILYYLMFCMYFVSNAYVMWFPYITNRFIEGLNNETSNENFCTVVTQVASENSTQVAIKMNTEEVCDDSISDITYLVIIGFSMAAGTLNILCAYVVSWLGKKIFTIVLLAITGFCGFIINWVYSPITGLILFIIFNYECLAMGIVPAYAVEIYPTYVRGMSVCLSIMVARFGAFLGVYIIGIIFKPQCEMSFYIYSIIIISCALISLLLPDDGKKKKSGSTLAKSDVCTRL